MSDLPEVIGHYLWLMGYLNYPYDAEYATSDIYGVRELPTEIHPYSRADLVQVQVMAFGELAWINVDRRDVTVQGDQK